MVVLRDGRVRIGLEGLSEALRGLASFHESAEKAQALNPIKIGIQSDTTQVTKLWSALRTGQPRQMSQSEIDSIFGTTPATQSGLAKLTQGLEKVNTVLGRNVFHTESVGKLSNGFTALTRNVGLGAEGAGVLESGLGMVALTGVAAFAAVGLSVAAVTGYLSDAVGKAAEFRSELGEIARAYSLTQEQSKFFEQSTLQTSLRTGKSTSEINAIVSATLQAGGGGRGEKIDPAMVEAITSRAIEASKSLPGVDSARIAELISQDAEFLKGSSESLDTFVNRSTNSMIAQNQLFGANVEEQAATLGKISLITQNLRGNIEESGGSLKEGAGLELSAFAGWARGKIGTGQQGSAKMTELLGGLLTTDAGKRAELGGILGLSPEEVAARQQDPKQFIMDVLKEYRKADSFERAALEANVGDTNHVLSALAPQLDELSESMSEFDKRVNEGDITHANFEDSMKGLSGQTSLLWQNLATISTVIGNLFLPALIDVVTGINSFLGPIAKWAVDFNKDDNANAKTLAGIFAKIVFFGPLFGVIIDCLKAIWGFSENIWNVASKLSDWFGSIIAYAQNLWSYLTGTYSDDQARAYQTVHPEEAGKSLSDVKSDMPTLVKTIKDLPGLMAQAVKSLVPGASAGTPLAGSVAEWTKTNDVSTYTDQQLADQSATLAKQNYPNREEKDLKEVKNDIYDYLKETRDFPDKPQDTQKLNQHTTFEVGGSYNPTISLPLTVSKEDEAGYEALADSPEYSPGFAKGGFVERSGLAGIHAGEVIVPAQVAASSRLQEILGTIASGSVDNSSRSITVNLGGLTVNTMTAVDEFDLLRKIENVVADAIRNSQSY